MRKRTASGLATAVAVTTGLGLGLAAPASANGGNSDRTGSCSDGSTWELKASASRGGEGHTIEVTLKIRGDVEGETWTYTLTDNGNVAASGEVTTNDKLKQSIPNLRGFDKIVLDAANSVTGETCHGHVVLNGSH